MIGPRDGNIRGLYGGPIDLPAPMAAEITDGTGSGKIIITSCLIQESPPLLAATGTNTLLGPSKVGQSPE